MEFIAEGKLSSPLESEACTQGIRVRVRAEYVAAESQPQHGHWFFAYHISITNEGDKTVQLLSRAWLITDAHGHTEEVRGPGVIGEQPVLAPGDEFEYTSACPLPTPFGSMEGSYQMVTEAGQRFDAAIERFSLSEPYAIN